MGEDAPRLTLISLFTTVPWIVLKGVGVEGAVGLLLVQLLIIVVISPDAETTAIALMDLTKNFLRDIFIKLKK